VAKVTFPLSSFPGENPSEGAGRLINCYAEPMGEGGRAAAVRHRVPGLVQFATSEETTPRGFLLSGGDLFTAYDGELVLFNDDGTETAVDDLDGTDRVFFAKNNKRPTADIVAVCGAGAFVITTSTVTDLNDSDLPSPTDVCFTGGYFFFPIADGRCFASGLNATTIASNDFITTEAKSDTLMRGIPWNGELWLFGSGSVEVWSGSSVNATGFPFNRVAVMQRGLAGKLGVAGHEDGFGKALIWVGDDNAIYRANGYTSVMISNPDLNRLIENVADKSTLEASVYIAGGQPRWVIKCASWCWEYNLSTEQWNERKSYNEPTWRASGGSVYAFGKWLTGDTEDGRIGEIARSARDEYGEPLIAEAWSLPVQNFPNRVQCSRADFDFAPGVGIIEGEDPIETDPGVEISYSDDGGYSFWNPRVRKLGRQGRPLTRVTVLKNGLSGAQGRIWKVAMSDPAHFGLMSGDMTAASRVG
jgi:hypothetical protein